MDTLPPPPTTEPLTGDASKVVGEKAKSVNNLKRSQALVRSVGVSLMMLSATPIDTTTERGVRVRGSLIRLATAMASEDIALAEKLNGELIDMLVAGDVSVPKCNT